MADVIANAVGRSYPATAFTNLGKLACSTTGDLGGCGCMVNGSFTPRWDTFGAW